MAIVSDEDVLGGEPRIEGTRIGVRHIAGRIIGNGQSTAYVADQLDISLARVYEALSYYYDNIEEMREVERAARESGEWIKKNSLGPKETVE